jgi:hypothetical protein
MVKYNTTILCSSRYALLPYLGVLCFDLLLGKSDRRLYGLFLLWAVLALDPGGLTQLWIGIKFKFRKIAWLLVLSSYAGSEIYSGIVTITFWLPPFHYVLSIAVVLVALFLV